jgi:type II pantothenate kinase
MKKIGIDAGGSLIKMVYEEEGHLRYRTYASSEMDSLLKWIGIMNPSAKLFATGGKTFLFHDKFPYPFTMVEEFKAMVEGSRFLLAEEFHLVEDEYILISIGTGTSIYYVTPDHYERVLGTGMGGGAFVGLGTILSGTNDFSKLVERTERGNRENVDLLVKDIYGPDITPMVGELTAANFGKVYMNNGASVDDYLASTMQMIGETIFLLASQTARMKGIEKLVFVGSTLTGNQTLKKILKGFADSQKMTVYFPTNGAYTGAIGAYLQK